MGKFRGVLLASDFDGTLTDSSGSIVPRNTEAIRYFISEGGFFTISTGRTAAGFHNYSEDIINAPVLLANGAMAYDYKTQQAAFINGIGNDNLDILKRIVDNFLIYLLNYTALIIRHMCLTVTETVPATLRISE